MIIILLLFLVFLVCMIMQFINIMDDKWLHRGVVNLLLIMPVFFLSVIVYTSNLKNKLDTYNEITRSTEIISLQSENNIHARFILGTGTIDEEKQYYFYQKTHNGMFIQNHLPVKRTFIKESSTEIPHYEKITRKFTNKFNYILFIPLHSNYNVLVVPKNTIIRKFQLN